MAMTSDRNYKAIVSAVSNAEHMAKYNKVMANRDRAIKKLREQGSDLITVKMADDMNITVVKYPHFHTLRINIEDDEKEYVADMKRNFRGLMTIYVRPFWEVAAYLPQFTGTNIGDILELAHDRDNATDMHTFIYGVYYHYKDECLDYEWDDFCEAVNHISCPINRTKAALRMQED
jgi:hypothetical protein